MALRFAQMALALVGMWLILARGVVRTPAWGQTGNQPVHWVVSTGPLGFGIVCLVIAMGLIFARNR